jgi:serine/threonine protein kinase
VLIITKFCGLRGTNELQNCFAFVIINAKRKGKTHMTDSLTGKEIDGYKIGPLLGAGGMGEVYQAISVNDDSVVAIKFLRSGSYADAKMQGRFAREIRIMQSLNHPNIMPIYKSGLFDDTVYYTMRLINGQTLSTFLRRRKLSPLEFYPILEQLVSAVQHGHAHDLVHRDIKPDNVFIERNKETSQILVTLGDFGLGKRVGIDHTLTEADSVLGTPQYMAPEAVLGEPITYRADLYALGVVTYEVLVGRPPFNEEKAHMTAMLHITKAVPPPSGLNPSFPDVLERVLLKTLEKKPDARYTSAEEFLKAYVQAMNLMTDAERRTVYAV